MNRRLLASIGVLGLVVLAGCTGGVVNEEALSEETTYDWDTDAAATINVTGEDYRAVITLENQSTVELYREAQIGGEDPLPIRAVQFRYPNGTVVNASSIRVEEADSRTVVELPTDDGTFAYTVRSRAGELFLPVDVNGSHEVILPPGTRISAPIIGVAEPAGFETSIDEDDRVHLYWDSMDSDTLSVSYYLERDLYLFGGLIGLVMLVAGAGWLYFRYQLRSLQAERDQAGLDVEDEE